jgi:hypothetical protein
MRIQWAIAILFSSRHRTQDRAERDWNPAQRRDRFEIQGETTLQNAAARWVIS